MLERLHKVLARSGVAALRPAEDMIMEGRVTVNGRTVRELGARVDPDTDVIAVDGQIVEIRAPDDPFRYVAVYKPTDVISTASDTHDRPTVTGLVPSDERLFPVGRLDADSEGLLLLTNDGDLAYRLTHPRFEVEKEYRVLLDRIPTIEDLRRWRDGVQLDDKLTLPAWVEVLERAGESAWVRVVMREGRKRQIREVARLLGYNVLRLIRVREGSLALGDLRPGQWRELSGDEVEQLRAHTRHIPSQEDDERRGFGGPPADRVREARGPRPFADQRSASSGPYGRRARAYDNFGGRRDPSDRPDRAGPDDRRAPGDDQRPRRPFNDRAAPRRDAAPGDRPRRTFEDRGGPRRTPDRWSTQESSGQPRSPQRRPDDRERSGYAPRERPQPRSDRDVNRSARPGEPPRNRGGYGRPPASTRYDDRRGRPQDDRERRFDDDRRSRPGPDQGSREREGGFRSSPDRGGPPSDRGPRYGRSESSERRDRPPRGESSGERGGVRSGPDRGPRYGRSESGERGGGPRFGRTSGGRPGPNSARRPFDRNESGERGPRRPFDRSESGERGPRRPFDRSESGEQRPRYGRSSPAGASRDRFDRSESSERRERSGDNTRSSRPGASRGPTRSPQQRRPGNGSRTGSSSGRPGSGDRSSFGGSRTRTGDGRPSSGRPNSGRPSSGRTPTRRPATPGRRPTSAPRRKRRDDE